MSSKSLKVCKKQHPPAPPVTLMICTSGAKINNSLFGPSTRFLHIVYNITSNIIRSIVICIITLLPMYVK